MCGRGGPGAVVRLGRELPLPPLGVLALVAATAAAPLGPPFAELPASPGITAAYQLRDGKPMTMFGLGVYQAEPGDTTYNSVKWALELGYRMVDTATVYGNEADVGRAIRDSGIPRSDIFLTTKLWDDAHGYDETIRACEESLARLGDGVDYLDLYLIHSPNTGKLVETWDGMLEVKRRGMTRSVGVSNFNIQHIQSLVDHNRELPVVNQIEMHPLVYHSRKDLLQFCFERQILVQAYGSIFFGEQRWLSDPAVVAVVAAHPGKTAAQVLLCWAVQMGFQVIPKSTKRHRLEENSQIFDFALTEADMARLGAMEGHLGVYWNPLEVPVHVGHTKRGEL